VESPWTDAIRASDRDSWFLDQPERAARRLDSVTAVHPLATGPPGTRPYYTVAQIYAHAGRPDRAREVLRGAAALPADTVLIRTSSSGRLNAEGEIAFADGKPLEAIRLWRQADTLPDGPDGACAACLYASLGRGFAAARQPDSAIYWYEKYLTTPHIARYTTFVDPYYLAAAYKSLGELYEEKGNRARAREYYQKLIALWDKADPELQHVVETVKARANRLAGEPPPRQ
jgi:tetratricopeptide (TPR) repeat protein